MTTTELKTARYYDLGITDLIALLTLAERGDLPMTALADEVGLTTAAITGTADKLAKKGLVKRAHSSTDRRSISLTMTELGRARLYQITGRRIEPAEMNELPDAPAGSVPPPRSL